MMDTSEHVALESTELLKNIRVTDPHIWYGKDIIEVHMRVLLDHKTVRITFYSIDDFSVYRDVNEWDLEANWEWCKKWLWDKIPEVLDCTWLYEHGYLPW